jgi:hypothetical protein
VSGRCSEHSLCHKSVGFALGTICVIRQWAVFWTEFVSCGSGLCSGHSLCHKAVGCVLGNPGWYVRRRTKSYQILNTSRNVVPNLQLGKFSSKPYNFLVPRRIDRENHESFLTNRTIKHCWLLLHSSLPDHTDDMLLFETAEVSILSPKPGHQFFYDDVHIHI